MKKHITRFAAFKALALGSLLIAAVSTASAQDASATYRPTERDPFVKYKPPVKKKKVEKKVPPMMAAPSVKERIDQYKARKLAAMNAQQTAPKATTALLLDEIQVTGIFRTPRGYAAMVEATPIKLSYVIYPGEVFFNGQLVAIEENRLVFRRETRFADGRREMTVEMKPLRQANAVNDSMAATRAANPAPAESAKSKEEKAAVNQ